ncbi:MAG TPA: hypothetical protein VF329_07145 [Gammaproteobacteria bacterium]
MNDDQNLRDRARQAMRAGALPNRRPSRTWGGPGAGAACTICGTPVAPNEVELEVEFVDDVDGTIDKHHMHVRCFAAWEAECQGREDAQSAPSRRVRRGTLPDVEDDGDLSRRGPSAAYKSSSS